MTTKSWNGTAVQLSPDNCVNLRASQTKKLDVSCQILFRAGTHEGLDMKLPLFFSSQTCLVMQQLQWQLCLHAWGHFVWEWGRNLIPHSSYPLYAIPSSLPSPVLPFTLVFLSPFILVFPIYPPRVTSCMAGALLTLWGMLLWSLNYSLNWLKRNLHWHSQFMLSSLPGKGERGMEVHRGSFIPLCESGHVFFLSPLSSPNIHPSPSEESGTIPGVGVDKLLEIGKLDKLKSGPLFWVDSSESHPRIGEKDLLYSEQRTGVDA